MATELEQKLLKMKDEIDRAKSQRDQAEGALTQLTDQLFKEFKVKTVEEANKLLSKMDSEITALEEQIEEKVRELDEAWQW